MPYPNYTLKPIGGDFATLTTWESQAQNDFDNTQPIVLECYDGDYGGPDGDLQDEVALANWNPSVGTEANPVTIRAAQGHGHNGVIGQGFRLQNLTANANVIYIGWQGTDHFVNIEGFSIRGSLAGGGQLIGDKTDAIVGTTMSAIRNMILGPNGSFGILSTDRIIENNFIQGCNYGYYNLNTLPKVSNCTVVDSGLYGFYPNWNTYIRNCVAVGSSGSDFRTGITLDGANCSSGDTTAGSIGTTGVVLTDDVDFIAPSLGDYKPTNSGVLLYQTGADLSADFTDDITGGERVGWDIGAYAYETAAPANDFADTNAFTITIAAGGIDEMWVKEGASFVTAKPYVNIGGVWTEVDAYVVDGGVWKPVYQK